MNELELLRAEQVIAKLISDPAYRAEVMLFLHVQDFPNTDHRKIYKAIRSLTIANQAVDPLRLAEVCEVDLQSIPTKYEQNLDLLGAARRLHEDGNRFRVQGLISDFLDKSDGKGFSFDGELDKLMRQIGEPLDFDFGGKVGSVPFNEFLDSLNHKITSVGKTGIRKLDELLQGMEQGHVYTFLGGSGVGKTMVGVQVLAESVAMGTACMYISNEMSSNEIVSRLVARRSGISSVSLRRGQFDMSEARFGNSIEEIADSFKQTGSVIIDKIHDPYKAIKVIRYYVMKQNIKLVVVDHMNNFSDASDYESFSKVAHNLQAVAQEMNVALVLLSQISKESEKNNDIEKVTSKGAKDVDEVSNVIIALKRRRVDKSDAVSFVAKEDDPNYMTFIVTKNRDGMTGKTGAYITFPNMVMKQDENA